MIVWPGLAPVSCMDSSYTVGKICDLYRAAWGRSVWLVSDISKRVLFDWGTREGEPKDV